MQEELYSHRLLVFINNEVYFRCRRQTLDELATLLGSPVDINHDFSLMQQISLAPANIDAFQILVQYYTRRDLTYQSDILRASLGVIRAVTADMQINFVEGLFPPLERR